MGCTSLRGDAPERRVVFWRMVEAAGIEPASEKDHRKETTCFFHSNFSTTAWKWTSSLWSSSINLGCKATNRSPATQLAKMTPRLTCEHVNQSGYLIIRPRVQTACYWQLLFTDRFTGARNPACLSTVITIPSNPVRPLTFSLCNCAVTWQFNPNQRFEYLQIQAISQQGWW